MKEQSAAGILGTTIEKIRDLVDVSTIIGDPMYLEGGITIIPISGRGIIRLQSEDLLQETVTRVKSAIR